MQDRYTVFPYCITWTGIQFDISWQYDQQPNKNCGFKIVYTVVNERNKYPELLFKIYENTCQENKLKETVPK